VTLTDRSVLALSVFAPSAFAVGVFQLSSHPLEASVTIALSVAVFALAWRTVRKSRRVSPKNLFPKSEATRVYEPWAQLGIWLLPVIAIPSWNPQVVTLFLIGIAAGVSLILWCGLVQLSAVLLVPGVGRSLWRLQAQDGTEGFVIAKGPRKLNNPLIVHMADGGLWPEA